MAFLTTEGELSDTVIKCVFLYLKTPLPGLWKVTPLGGRIRGREAPEKEEGKSGGIHQIKRGNEQCRM